MSLTYCKCCSAPRLSPLWLDNDGGQWYRCAACGSDSADRGYDPGQYDAHYLAAHHRLAGNPAETARILAREMESNLSWFGHHATNPGRDFLDVGSAEGTALRGMAALGWSVHGFDVNPVARAACPPGDHVTIAPWFHAGLFAQRYDAVLCREVIEHVPGWRQMLHELALVTHLGGLVQLQTPRPCAALHPIPYQGAHLQLFAPGLLRRELERVGLAILDWREWEIGQAALCRKVAG